MTIVRGTTPTVDYSFSTIDPRTLDACYMTISQDGETIIERDSETMNATSTTASWELTQEDTLGLIAGKKCEIQLRYVTSGGLAYASAISSVEVLDVLKKGVI